MSTVYRPAEERLQELVMTIEKSGDPNRDFFYLGGPMTGIPLHNFPRFKEVAQVLRDNTYNIVSPAEIDTPEVEEAVYNDPNLEMYGEVAGTPYLEFLERDLTIICMPTCVGGIFMEGWEDSRGAREEIKLLTTLKKQVFEFHDNGGLFGLPGLTMLKAPLSTEWVSSPGDVVYQ